MRTLSILTAALATLSLPAGAQVKDGDGNELHLGRPLKPIADYNGGTISKGRAAQCVLDGGPRKVCTFYPRNGDGSFAIDVDGRAFYADKTSPERVVVDYDNGARMVPQGAFTRSKRDPRLLGSGQQPQDLRLLRSALFDRACRGCAFSRNQIACRSLALHGCSGADRRAKPCGGR